MVMNIINYDIKVMNIIDYDIINFMNIINYEMIVMNTINYETMQARKQLMTLLSSITSTSMNCPTPIHW